MLQSSTELYRYELYKSSGTGSDDSLEFAGLINHSLLVHKAEDVTAGVDSALEQLRSNMAAISEFKEANKYASPVFPWLPTLFDITSKHSSTPVADACRDETKLCIPGLTKIAAGPLLATLLPAAHQPIVASLRRASRHTSVLP